MLPSVSSLYCAAIVPFFQANVHQIGATPSNILITGILIIVIVIFIGMSNSIIGIIF
jgi:preprotein translocase subunit Sec61beta